MRAVYLKDLNVAVDLFASDNAVDKEQNGKESQHNSEAEEPPLA